MTPTYYGKDLQSDKNYVIEELKYLKPETLRTGIGSMCTSNSEWNYDWTQSTLTNFLNFLKYNVSVPSVDIWRADIDYSTDNTEKWFYQALVNFHK